MNKRKAHNRINFTIKEEKEIINLYKKSFWSHKRLMNKFGVSQCVIDRVLRENNVSANKTTDYRRIKLWSKRIIFTRDEELKIINLFKEKLLSSKDIGKVMGCSVIPIYRVLKENNIDTSLKKRIKELYDKGKLVMRKGREHPSYGKVPHNKKHFSEAQIERMINMYNVDLINPIKIGKIFECDSDVIRRILKENMINTGSFETGFFGYSCGGGVGKQKKRPISFLCLFI